MTNDQRPNHLLTRKWRFTLALCCFCLWLQFTHTPPPPHPPSLLCSASTQTQLRGQHPGISTVVQGSGSSANTFPVSQAHETQGRPRRTDKRNGRGPNKLSPRGPESNFKIATNFYLKHWKAVLSFLWWWWLFLFLPFVQAKLCVLSWRNTDKEKCWGGGKLKKSWSNRAQFEKVVRCLSQSEMLRLCVEE